ncbi:MAG: alpha-glucosidase, partial [Bacilli bacterium]|nr:alpha-glucosidase [Bacilli bacterium]
HVDFSDEYGFASLVPANIGLACSGVGITHSDIGGYTTIMFMKRNAELMKRWSEANIFTSVYRTHEGNRPKDNVQYDNPDVYEEFIRNTALYAKLKPYREAVNQEYYEKHIPTIRPLFFHYENERALTHRRQYMYGHDLIVAPVFREGRENIRVYLPEEGYIQLFTGKKIPAGESYVETPIGLPIAFYREDSPFQELFASLQNEFDERK